ncbi:hypothetical protein Sango_2619900 [Sesamum angolense]|uniref:Uncharacterized protein n=1 Tax=Sesamum angolense TaxID=2727404 RepID=A0AAE1TAD3_9LAMI|nr:hypothetical protein Sango_2619900 [Sesamum angolense]
MGAAVCELLWLLYFLRALQIPFTTPVPFWCDNKAAIHITANPVFHERTKHLDIDCHLVRDQFKLGFILPSHVPGRDQLADIFTKPHLSVILLVSSSSWAWLPNLHLAGGMSKYGIAVLQQMLQRQKVEDDEVDADVLPRWTLKVY